MGKNEKAELARIFGEGSLAPGGQSQSGIQALLEAGQTLRALSTLVSSMVNRAALMLDCSILYDACAARLTGAASGPQGDVPDEAVLRTLVKEAIEAILSNEHLRLLSLQGESDWDDFGGPEGLQLQNFGRSPEETRRNAVHFNGLPMKTRQAFFGVTRPLPADASATERQALLKQAKASRALCAHAMKVLLGREVDTDE